MHWMDIVPGLGPRCGPHLSAGGVLPVTPRASHKPHAWSSLLALALPPLWTMAKRVRERNVYLENEGFGPGVGAHMGPYGPKR